MLILDNQIQDKHFKKSIDIVYFRKFCLFDNKSIIMYNKISFATTSIFFMSIIFLSIYDNFNLKQPNGEN